MKSIYLIGLPGCGKTTIGVGLAERLNCEFLDLDSVIEFEEKKKISLIFQDEGESYFRKVEEKVVLNSPKLNTVVATGGGAPCFFNNMGHIKRNGLSVYLKISVEELFNRLHGKGISGRPLLANKTDEELFTALQQKIKDREQFYNQADIVVEGDNLSVYDVYAAIKDKLKFDS